MARKDLPYLPLYVQDFLTDEKLMECSASATGVYIRIMCVLHKCIPYGKLLLKQKDKQTDNQINNFASKLAKHFPYELPVILAALNELVGEDVLQVEEDFLIQKRMVNDGLLSVSRSVSGREGGLTTQKFAKAKQVANGQANADIEIDNEIDINNTLHNQVKNSKNGEKNKSGDSRTQSEELSLRRISEGEQRVKRNREKDNKE